ncbi:MAG TPA: YidC/Oxa1 family insertase periplasmic-domain containing protein, partial [Gemmatimonadales bacterium]|nr:YidC/Oxa1 family insertase periplasmic-domain containing protein [Gemmatimonadales bacterium]
AGGDTASLANELAAYRFTSLGAAIEQATLPEYRSFGSGDSGAVRLVRPGDRLLAHRLLVERETLALDTANFAIERGRALGFTAATALGAVSFRYGWTPQPYVIAVEARLEPLVGRGGRLLVGLGTGFRNAEGDSADNYRKYGVSVRRPREAPEVHGFGSVDPGELKEISGPLDWVAVKSKYFLGAVLSPDSTRATLSGAVMQGMERRGRTAIAAETWVAIPVGPDGMARYQLYLGPIQQGTIRPLGRDLDRASPYGWIFRPLVMPVARWITQLFLWMHENLKLSFGAVLVIFGVLVRLVLWPLNQRAMKSQVAMMAVQPILQDIQKRYKNDPQRLQQEMMKVYREHKVNPFGGCLPLLLPFPVLLALFFVFSNAIELRGTPFLWLPDLSLKDPYYIIPLVMGVSMYALSKLSQTGMPPNPQAKMMTTVMPIMMTVLFANFASGVNLYYAVSNIVSLPQQWLINKARAAEMARRQVSR